MGALAGTVKQTMFGPDSDVQTASMTEGDVLFSVDATAMVCQSVESRPCSFADLDGDQILDFYWIDPIEAAKWFISRPKFKGKLYTQFERQNSTERPGKRGFGRANAGLVFQTCQAVDEYSSPLLLLFYADKSFSGKHRTHHPIYSECYNAAAICTGKVFP